MTDLRPIPKEAIPRALEKVERYRLLNEPGEAESICRDVLRAEPGHQRAVVMLLLALTDQFPDGVSVNEPRALLEKIEDDYERAYYEGIIDERRGKALLKGGTPGAESGVHDWLQAAMRSFERAAELSPPGNADATLRWNACARILRDRGLGPRPEDAIELPLE